MQKQLTIDGCEFGKFDCLSNFLCDDLNFEPFTDFVEEEYA